MTPPEPPAAPPAPFPGPFPTAGDPLPDRALVLADGSPVRPGYAPQGWSGRRMVLFFYPRDMTPGCTNEAIAFSALRDRFAAAGIAILGISKDPPARHRAFIARHALTVDLATDAQSDGLSDALGLWTEKQLYGRRFMGMLRTTLLVSAEGRIERIWPKVKVAGHAEAVLAAAMQDGAG